MDKEVVPVVTEEEVAKADENATACAAMAYPEAVKPAKPKKSAKKK